METLASYKVQSWLTWFLRGVLILGFLILLARLIDLSIIRGSYFKSLADGNRIRRVPIIAPRGKIFARGGELIVDNKEVKLHLTFDKTEGYKKSEKVEGVREDEIIYENQRNYTSGINFAHVTGYLGQIGEEELGKVRAECPDKGPRRIGDFVGRGGLEQEYDCLLSGIDGEELIEVDALGRKIRTLGRKQPIPGNDIYTTIDFGLQTEIARLMNEKKGAVIVTDLGGEILALYSSPSFDPNVFISGDNSDVITKLLNDQDLPLFNRVISGKYHPGSVYKPLVALVALQEGAINKDFRFTDTGQIVVDSAYGTFSYKNWYFTQYGGVEGTIGIERALARSTDTLFYKLGELVGAEKIADWSGRFGLDQKTSVDLPGEIAGFIPSPSWKIKELGERWFLGNTYHMAIGQGDIALTAIEVNRYIAAIASGGTICKPDIFSNKVSSQSNFGVLRTNSNKETCSNLKLDKGNLDLVIKGMTGACSSGGTGYTFFDFEEKSGVNAACKTGTAQTENGEPHAWFTVFAPIENPQLVATILVENGGEGSKVAGPIARDIFNYWFKVITPTPTLVHE